MSSAVGETITVLGVNLMGEKIVSSVRRILTSTIPREIEAMGAAAEWPFIRTIASYRLVVLGAKAPPSISAEAWDRLELYRERLFQAGRMDGYRYGDNGILIVDSGLRNFEARAILRFGKRPAVCATCGK